MNRSRLQALQAQLVQPPADRALVHLHRKPTGHLGPQVHAAPTHDLVDRRIGTLDHQFAQLGLLRLAQSRHPTGRE